MPTKASHPRCKVNFGNLTLRILILQTTWFWLFLHDFGTKSRFSFGNLILQATWFTAYLHDFGTKSRFSFGVRILQTSWFTANLLDFGTKSRFSFGILILQTTFFTVYLHDLGTKSRFSFWILILQTSWFTAYLHDLGTKSRFSFGCWSFKKKGWDKCLQKPLIHDAKLILEILLFGSWSSKLPGSECFLHDFGTKSRFSFGILILQTSWYLHDLGTKLSRFNLRILILQKKDETHVYKSLSSTMQT